MRDAYDKLFSKYGREDFFRDSLNEIIFVAPDKIAKNWESQKHKLLDNKQVFIRGYGRSGINTKAFVTLYKHLFKNEHVIRDATNNAKPTKFLAELTGLCKVVKIDRDTKERIQNYQVSHLFGRTKNPLLFTAAWNIAYIPKYIDPFTGHETQGDHRIEFQNLFVEKIFGLFNDYVEDYNQFIVKRVTEYLDDALVLTKQELKMEDILFEDFRENAINELSEIKRPFRSQNGS